MTTVVLSLLLAALLSVSAVLKLSHRPRVVASYLRVGVPERHLDRLALLLLMGAAGTIGGLFFAPLGMLTSACLSCYFLVAVWFHVRARAYDNVAMPVLLLLLAAALLTLQIAMR
jgi:hypothetical protein